MNKFLSIKQALLSLVFALICFTSFANKELFLQARNSQREGNYDEAIKIYKSLLTQTTSLSSLSDQQLFFYTEGLMQLMNAYQSNGEPEACITALNEIFEASTILQDECLRDYYSVLGYALSRTERMEEAEQMMLKAIALPLHRATPERYFRDYAYAAAVFYNNPNYHKEVISWCQEALRQAELTSNTSGAQYVQTMLGSLYKRYGLLNEALEMLQKSKETAEQNGDDLGMLVSLNALADIFIYYDIPEYANLYATDAVRVAQNTTENNPMITAQTYINKGRVLHSMGDIDSATFYNEKARTLCQSLPYNSGMADVNILGGRILTARGGEFVSSAIKELEQVVQHGTALSRANAYHLLAQTYLKERSYHSAETALDSLYTLLNSDESLIHIRIDYEPIINHYLQNNNHAKVAQYAKLMAEGQKSFRERRLNFNLAESIAKLQTEQKIQELKIAQLAQTNQHLLILVFFIVALVAIIAFVVLYVTQRRRLRVHLRRINEDFAQMRQELDRTNDEKHRVTQEIKELLNESENRQEIETLTPFILKESGETKFRQCFELLHPLFLHRLRERVPSITRREELLSMLIVLKQDNREIAELLAIAPRSVLMLRHRFRQKIGMATEYSLEHFIEQMLDAHDTQNRVSER